MSDKRPDPLAERIRQRRAAATGVPAKSPEVALCAARAEAPSTLVALKTAIDAARGRPLEVARLLAEAEARGHKPVDIAEALGVARTWVAKRLSLSRAPPDVRAAIEAGTLGETAYYNHRGKVAQELHREAQDQGRKRRRRQGAPYARHPKVALSEPAGRAAAHLLAHLAFTLNLAPIDVDAASLRALRAILELRAPELWDALKKTL